MPDFSRPTRRNRSIVVVEPALEDDQGLVLAAIDQSMLLGNAPRPPSLQVAAERFRFADARKWIAAKLKPNRYGDKVELSGDKNAPVSIQIVKFSDD